MTSVPRRRGAGRRPRRPARPARGRGRGRCGGVGGGPGRGGGTGRVGGRTAGRRDRGRGHRGRGRRRGGVRGEACPADGVPPAGPSGSAPAHRRCRSRPAKAGAEEESPDEAARQQDGPGGSRSPGQGRAAPTPGAGSAVRREPRGRRVRDPWGRTVLGGRLHGAGRLVGGVPGIRGVRIVRALGGGADLHERPYAQLPHSISMTDRKQTESDRSRRTGERDRPPCGPCRVSRAARGTRRP